ncbi:hypothetical protein CTEN210_00675 [Chaetoceros tenuissimus]|uniref:Uncharacterized protein n=1 Tax=Chaetoceros tenuissimus TaxID=426638 RepID=A0AAD3CE92_9STRA|nr:hypothetical protein CTEN210_00675 [Chaetoceros tenuissimus]
MPKRKSPGKSFCIFDLNVPVVLARNKGSSNNKNSTEKNRRKAPPSKWQGSKEEQHALLKRLSSIGYKTVALSHLVHGRVKEHDDANEVIPNSFMSFEQQEPSSQSKKQKSQDIQDTRSKSIKILKRLDVIIEQESDLAHYTKNTDAKTKAILETYDLIALSPQNETVLSAICNSSTLYYADVIILDYTAGRGGVQLPFKIKRTHIMEATKRGLTFDLPYAPALVDSSKRKSFVQASRQFIQASVGVLKPKPRIIFSSGKRTLDGRDYGSLLLRSSQDMLNFCKVVLGFENTIISRAMTEYPSFALKRGQNRKHGKVSCHGNFTIKVKSENDDDLSDSADGDCKDANEGDVESSNVANKDDGEELLSFDLHTGKGDVTMKEENVDGGSESEDDSDDEDGFLRLS